MLTLFRISLLVSLSGLLVAANIPTDAPFRRALTPLVDPAKLATLGPRGANPRVQKCVYWVESARRAQVNVTNLLNTVMADVGMKPKAAALTRDAILRNRDIADRLECLDAAGMEDMRRGQSPTIRKGPYAGDQLSVDHVIPRAVYPQFDNVLANLELMPMRMNAAKQDKMGPRQLQLLRQFRKSGSLPLESPFTEYNGAPHRQILP